MTLGDKITQYCDGVLTSDIAVGEYHRLAVERFGKLRERLHWSEESAQFAVDFFGLLKHSKGKWAGDTFELSDWQEFIVANVFGFLRDDGSRAMRTAYTSVARKNGKSTFAAGVGLLMFVADGEGGAATQCRGR